MTAKGSSRANCCCDGCETIPSVVEQTYGLKNVPINPGLPLPHITIAGHPPDAMQAFCCSCLPKTVCVGIRDDDTLESSTVLTSLRCNLGTQTGDSDPTTLFAANSYSATVPFRGVNYDLQFWFKVVDFKCYFCLYSTALGIVDDRQEITAEKRASKPWIHQPYNGFCETLNSDTANPPTYGGTEWHFSNPYVGNLTIAIGAQDTVPISARRPCLDDLGHIVFDTSLLKNKCDGCGCVCSRACVIIQDIGNNLIYSSMLVIGAEDDADVEQLSDVYHEVDAVPYDSSSTGTKIQVVRNPKSATGRGCALKILQLGHGLEYVGTPPLVDIQQSWNSLNWSNGQGCPNPTAYWELTSPAGFPIIVHFSCAECASGCGTLTAGCCDGYPIPRILHCTISKGDSEISASCECLPITIPMVSYSGLPFWNGKYRNTPIDESWCFPVGFHDFQVQLECGSQWTLRFGNSLYHASPCASVIFGADYATGIVCSPIMLVFTYKSHCCGGIQDPNYPVSLPGPASIVFTITE